MKDSKKETKRKNVLVKIFAFAKRRNWLFSTCIAVMVTLTFTAVFTAIFRMNPELATKMLPQEVSEEVNSGLKPAILSLCLMMSVVGVEVGGLYAILQVLELNSKKKKQVIAIFISSLTILITLLIIVFSIEQLLLCMTLSPILAGFLTGICTSAECRKEVKDIGVLSVLMIAMIFIMPFEIVTDCVIDIIKSIQKFVSDFKAEVLN